ncbi:hypothetical protein A7U35_04200 [Staphylococcus epidermidis]|uniref:hypothetical protein n=1 Tax=Staphylococcus epidermidis TaxID=1282 RepID=UPI0003302551|nr:hypothetical protein [Staphylococcus epidermidis]EON84674.1 hypothetical protein D592_15081 [Staphylococcus epidermidis 36-1]KZG48234.1 hypothetical protein A4U44_06260 [Staphylococcus epidermidis]KZG53459.1 hypothetical protein A0W31_06210 [Staphylococcus epidermidis]KZG56035.1 hypothetical protein A0W30_04510 [Staphylococcus epidermidis]KZG56318.1 hypothetical protein A4R96_05440 [Staphylococcus epidermidis]
MAEITKEQLLEFIRNKDLDLDESYPRSDWWKFRDERDSYKKQRDELINDMAEIKKKAEAFDEIDDLIVNGTLKDREPDAIFQNICHEIINFKEADHEG